MRSYRVPLGKKEIKVMNATFNKTECPKVYIPGFRWMHTAQIQGQFIVDENPEIVITCECEGVIGMISEAGMQFICEVIVM